MRVMLLSINHRTAAVDLREKLAYEPKQHENALISFRDHFPGAEIVILSTCNRTELYAACPEPIAPPVDRFIEYLAHDRQLPMEQIRSASIYRENDQAVNHLFRVTAGLESMVLGEPQILGQVKKAYEASVRHDRVGFVLHQVFQSAIAVGKQVRTTTQIDAGRCSIGSIAVDFARQIFERFDNKTIVGLGAGQMAKITLRHLQSLKPQKLWLINRTRDRAVALANRLGLTGPHAGARAFDDLDQLLTEADIFVTGATVDEPIITYDRFKPLLRRRRQRPLFFIDIAVPRNIDPAVGQLKNVYLYNIDDLQVVATQTHDRRGELVGQCESILFEAVRQCMSQIRHRDIGQLIHSLREKLNNIALAEQQRTTKKLSTIEAQPNQLAQRLPEALDEFSHRLINKILHLPLSQLDHKNHDAPLGFYAAALRKLFDIQDDNTASTQAWPQNQPQNSDQAQSLPVIEHSQIKSDQHQNYKIHQPTT